MMKRYSNLESFTDDLLNKKDMYSKLASLAGKKDYPGKAKRIKVKIQEEIELWSRKGSSPRLEDLKKDLSFLESLNEIGELEKERVDLLASKYSIGYGEVKRNPY